MQDGLPWSFPLIKCNLSWILSLLYRDDSVPEPTLTRIHDLMTTQHSEFRSKLKKTAAVIYARSQPFAVDLSRLTVEIGLHAVEGQLPSVGIFRLFLPRQPGRAEGITPESRHYKKKWASTLPAYTGERPFDRR